MSGVLGHFKLRNNWSCLVLVGSWVMVGLTSHLVSVSFLFAQFPISNAGTSL